MAFGADRSVKVALDLTVKGYLANLAAAKKATSDFSRDAQVSAKKNKEHWDKVGTSMLAVGAAAAAGVGLAVKRFADFDQAMSAAAAGTNATTLELNSLREAAIKAGADTQYSATEAAQAITEMGKAGVSTQDILGGGLTGALNLAAAGQLEVGRAAEIAATALSQFSLKGADLPHVADLFAAAAGKAQGSVEDVGLAMSYIGPVANAMGVSIEDATATIGLLAEQGIIGEKAGTGFRGMLLSLTAPSKAAKEAMEEYGVELYDANGKFVGMSGAADVLQRRLGGLDEKTRNAALGQIFGNESLTSAIALYKGGGAAVDAWRGKVDDAGFASKQAAKLTDNLKGDIERLGGSIDTVLIQGAGGANGPLRSMVQGMEKAVDGFGNLGPAGSEAAFGLAAVTAGIALVGGGAVIAVPKVVAFRTSLQTLGITAGRTGTALKVAGGAFTVFTVAAGSVALQNYIAQATVATVKTEDLAKSLVTLGQPEVTGALADLFRDNGGWLQARETFVSTTDVIERFGTVANDAFGEGALAKLARWQTGGKSLTIFEKQAKQLDASLAQMVRGGNAAGAKKVLGDLLSKVDPANVDKVRGKFSEMDAAVAEMGATAEGAAKQVNPLTGEIEKASEVTFDGAGNADAYGSALILMGDAAKGAEGAVKDLAKRIQSDMDSASKAFTSDLDVLGKYDPKAAAEKSKAATEAVTAAEQAAQDVRERIATKKKRTVSDTQALEKANARVDEARAKEQAAKAAEGAAGLEASYKASIKAAQTFSNDIAEVTRRGLDPQVVAKLLQEGPEKAAPALEAMLGKNSARMIEMVNKSEAALATINQAVVEQARLTSMAVNASTDTMVADLDTAMAIAQVKAAHGGKVTAEAIAKELNLGLPEVKRIAAEYGITLQVPPPKPVPVTVDTSKGRQSLADLNYDLDQLNGKTVKTYVETSTYVKPVAGQGVTTGWSPIKQASGGYISGPGTATSDSIPAYLSNGEYVIKAAAVSKYGSHFFDQLNTMRFASGGFVGGSVPVSNTHTETNTAPVYIDKVMGPDLASIEAEAERRRRLDALGQM